MAGATKTMGWRWFIASWFILRLVKTNSQSCVGVGASQFWQKRETRLRGVAQLCKLCGQRQSVPLNRRTRNHRHRLPVAAQVANLCSAPPPCAT